MGIVVTPEAVSRYPLEWPLGWKRTDWRHRFKSASFSTTVKVGDKKSQMRVNGNEATERLERQIELLGGADATLSTNVRLRLDGRPDTRLEDPSDPGAAVYFRFNGKATVLACDRYVRVADNIAALAAHIDALRRIERYGVGTIEQALAGYKALPADTAANWRAVFGFGENKQPTLDQLDSAYKQAAKKHHPDLGGSDADMAHLNRARDYALAELGG